MAQYSSSELIKEFSFLSTQSTKLLVCDDTCPCREMGPVMQKELYDRLDRILTCSNPGKITMMLLIAIFRGGELSFEEYKRANLLLNLSQSTIITRPSSGFVKGIGPVMQRCDTYRQKNCPCVRVNPVVYAHFKIPSDIAIARQLYLMVSRVWEGQTPHLYRPQCRKRAAMFLNVDDKTKKTRVSNECQNPIGSSLTMNDCQLVSQLDLSVRRHVEFQQRFDSHLNELFQESISLMEKKRIVIMSCLSH
jgi:hypothetical protein